jgi:tRNA (5-methylaminomethyl-2-thiouridylate)-methyltransferase
MKIAILLSGGVDSSVALNLLLDENKHDIVAYYLKIWLEDELAFLGECPWEEDLKYARAVCEQANVKLEVISLQDEYQNRIVSYVLDELKKGRTPSPDIYCNEQIKFGVFFDHLHDKFDKIATGHYAKIKQNDDNSFSLLRAPDSIKDQTYFLSNLNQEQLAKILFPLGEYKKNRVRELAQEYNLPNKSRKDSQGICFLGKIPYNDFVKFHLGEQPGDIIELETNKCFARHKGVWFHTIGQRKGLGLSGGPWYVVKKDVEKNIVYISHSEKLESCSRDTFFTRNINWINGETSSLKVKQLKLRHGPELIECKLSKESNEEYHVKISKPDSGIAEGQHAIFYNGEECLGGGIIRV